MGVWYSNNIILLKHSVSSVRNIARFHIFMAMEIQVVFFRDMIPSIDVIDYHLR
jgi:hypothetical protein